MLQARLLISPEFVFLPNHRLRNGKFSFVIYSVELYVCARVVISNTFREFLLTPQREKI